MERAALRIGALRRAPHDQGSVRSFESAQPGEGRRRAENDRQHALRRRLQTSRRGVVDRLLRLRRIRAAGGTLLRERHVSPGRRDRTRGALDTRPREPAPRTRRRRAAVRRPDDKRGARGHGHVHRVQGVQDGVSGTGRHGTHEDVVARPLARNGTADALPALHREPAPDAGARLPLAAIGERSRAP